MKRILAGVNFTAKDAEGAKEERWPRSYDEGSGLIGSGGAVLGLVRAFP